MTDAPRDSLFGYVIESTYDLWTNPWYWLTWVVGISIAFGGAAVGRYTGHLYVAGLLTGFVFSEVTALLFPISEPAADGGDSA